MEISTLRQFWSLIEETHTNLLLQLSDADLSELLLKQLENRLLLSLEENSILTNYIHDRIALIRDLASARLAKY